MTSRQFIVESNGDANGYYEEDAYSDESNINISQEESVAKPSGEYLSSQRPKSAIFSKFDQTIYLHASNIFKYLEHPPRDDGSFEASQKKRAYEARKISDMPLLDFESEIERRLTYELAYSTLKYQFILEDIMEDVAFWLKYPELSDDSPLVYVIMNDYMCRKFNRRELHRGERIYEHIKEIENCVSEGKIKLNAALARRRIKSSARSIDELLPVSFKVRDEMSNKLLTYAWVNFNKTTLPQVISDLQDEGYQVIPESSQSLCDNYFCLDNLFDDTLVFSSEQAIQLSNHRLVRDGFLVIQDKTSFFGPQAILSMLHSKEDVIVIESTSGMTAAHLSSLMKKSVKEGSVFLIASSSSHREASMRQTVDRLQSENIKVIPEDITNLEHDDPRFKQIKVALIHAQCSRSAVLDPVGFVITEGEDIEILKELSAGNASQDQINARMRNNLQAIKLCLKVPRMQAIVYVTRSIVEAENEKLVLKSVESHNANPSTKHPYRPIPPLFNFDEKSAEQQTDRYYRHSPSEQANGCFIAVLSRELEESKDTSAVLNRAAALGLLKYKSSTTTTVAEESGDANKPKAKTKKFKSRKSTASKQPKQAMRCKSSNAVAFGSSKDGKI